MIGAIILGILAGFIGKALMPGKDPGGFFVTILIGLAIYVVAASVLPSREEPADELAVAKTGADDRTAVPA